MQRLVTGLLAAFLIVSLIACSDDDAKTSCPGSGSAPSGGTGTFFNAYSMVVGTTYEAILTPGSADYYAFTLGSASSVTGCVGSGNADYELTLYTDGGGNPGSFIADCDEFFEGTDERCSTSEIGLTLSAGTYYVDVFNWGPSTDNYTVTVSTP